jgi:hypothetical protein
MSRGEPVIDTIYADSEAADHPVPRPQPGGAQEVQA